MDKKLDKKLDKKIETMELLDEEYYNKFMIDNYAIELKGKKKYLKKNDKIKQSFIGELNVDGKRKKIINSFKEYNRLLDILLKSK